MYRKLTESYPQLDPTYFRHVFGMSAILLKVEELTENTCQIMQWYRFKDDINLAPTVEGVYALSEVNSDSGVIYIGRADNLYERLSQHPDPGNPCLQRKVIRYFAFEETANSIAREQELINYYNPECNRV